MNILRLHSLIVFPNTDHKMQPFSTKISLIVNWKSRSIAALFKRKIYAFQKPFWIRNWPES